MFSEEALFSFLVGYAYSPLSVYGFIVLFMLMSGFGMPIPEEVILVSSGIIAYMAAHPNLYPPPYEGAEGVNLYVLSTVCLIAVLASDSLVYFIGKKYGFNIFWPVAKIKYFFKSKTEKEQSSPQEVYQELVNSKNVKNINHLFDKYGLLAVAIFRFTPGVRFPGHISCGMMGVPLWKFLAVDFSVALLSVPTQVLLVAFFGEAIIANFREFKLYLFLLIGILIVGYFSYKYWIKKKI